MNQNDEGQLQRKYTLLRRTSNSQRQCDPASLRRHHQLAACPTVHRVVGHDRGIREYIKGPGYATRRPVAKHRTLVGQAADTLCLNVRASRARSGLNFSMEAGEGTA